ncbi:hypothetical protein BDV19DRAFT_397397 [Aspergillus venezuelensis]
MSRAFSTVARRLKDLVWTTKGTTENVDWVKQYGDAAVDLVPKLKEVVDSGNVNYIVVIPTRHQKNNDPYQASVTFSKEGNRITSAHVYPDGRVAFSKKIYGSVQVPRIASAPANSGPEKKYLSVRGLIGREGD